MIFEPLTGWITSLLADGLIIASEKAKNDIDTDDERVKAKNSSVNNELRKRLSQGTRMYMDDVRELESIECYIQRCKDDIVYYHGSFELDSDVEAMINDLRKKCVTKLRCDATTELERYERERAQGASATRLEQLRVQASSKLEKANSVQGTVDMEERASRLFLTDW